MFLILFLIFSDHILMIDYDGEYTLSTTMLKSNETRPQIKQGYPLNLSILISGGKETNQDSPSNGEWNGISANLKSGFLSEARVVIYGVYITVVSSTLKCYWNILPERVIAPFLEMSRNGNMCCALWESGCLGLQPKMRVKSHVTLNTDERPIANK